MKVLILSLVPIAAFAVGALLAKRQNQMPRADRKELERLRSMREELITKAAEHATLGDDFAVIVLSILHDPVHRPKGGY